MAEGPRYATADHIYIYFIRGDSEDNAIFYDRSMPRNVNLPHLERRLEELRGYGYEPFYTIGTIMPGAFT